MIRKLFMVAGTAGLLSLGVACEQAKSTTSNATKVAGEKAKDIADKGKDAVEKGKEAVKEGADKAMEEAKATFLKPIEAMFPSVDEKIKALTGDGKTKAEGLLAGLKKLIEEFKSSPADKFKGLMQGITDKVAELKKSVGL